MPTLVFSSGIVDTMLQQAAPTTVFGSATRIGVDTGGSAEVQSLLAFTNLFGNGSGQIPLGATITSATLTLQTTNGSNQGGSLYRMLIGWNGQSTWSSLGSGVQFDGFEATSDPDLVTGAVATGSRGFDVTDSLQAWANGSANFGWVFKAGGTDGWDFYSSEGTVKPVLTVTYTTETSTTPVVSIENGSPNPQREGDGPITFTVSLNQVATQDVVVNYSTIGGSATATSDFIGVSNGQVTIKAGQTSAKFDIFLIDDAVVESPESFTVKINSAENAVIDRSTATGNIVDDDGTSTPTPPPPIQASVVHAYDTTQYKDGGVAGYGNGDPSGLAYVPGLNMLFIADSEHDESPYFSSVNLFAVRLDGTFVDRFSLTGFTKEPTGLAYNPGNGMLYITDDDKSKVFWVDPDNPTVKLGEFSTAPYGSDAEDPKFDPVTGHIFMLQGEARKLFELTATGEFVSSMTLPSVLTDAEALAYDARHDVFFVASGVSSKIWEIDRSGKVLATIDVFGNYRNPVNGLKPSIKGLELAPSSNPNDGNTMSLYVADYGADQKNDGRLFEVSLGSGWLVA